MTKEELEEYRYRLHKLGQDTGDKAAKLSEETFRSTSDEKRGNLSRTPVHPADASGDEYSHEVATNLLRTEREIEREINGALDRIERGTFGRCEACGKEISHNRLDSVPYARYCLRCSQHQEFES